MDGPAQFPLTTQGYTDCLTRTEKSELTLKSWNNHGTTSLEGSGVLGLELLGEIGRPSSRLGCLEPCREDAVCSRCRVLGILVSELRGDCRPSSPKNPATFLYGVALLVLVLDSEFWLSTVVALASDGLRSLLRNIGSGDSLSAVRPESGRNDDGDRCAFDRPSLKRLEDVRP